MKMHEHVDLLLDLGVTYISSDKLKLSITDSSWRIRLGWFTAKDSWDQSLGALDVQISPRMLKKIRTKIEST